MEPSLLPVFLKLAGRSVLVVGGGQVAESKVMALVATGAHLTVVAPAVSPGILKTGALVHRRAFEPSDLDGRWLVVSAAPPDVNRSVADEAERRAMFVNAVDDPPNATAYLGGVVRRDGVTIAISTSGRAPAIAGLLREAIDAVLPADLDRWMEEADTLRARWRAERTPMQDRRPELVDAILRLYDRSPA